MVELRVKVPHEVRPNLKECFKGFGACLRFPAVRYIALFVLYDCVLYSCG
jgi:hypothetical protein